MTGDGIVTCSSSVNVSPSFAFANTSEADSDVPPGYAVLFAQKLFVPRRATRHYEFGPYVVALSFFEKLE